MQTKQLVFVTSLVLLTLYDVSAEEAQAQALQYGPRGRIRIPDRHTEVLPQMPHLSSNSRNVYRPQLAPRPGGVPIYAPVNVPVLPAISSTVHTHIPLLRETSSQEMALSSTEAVMKESVVYGNWKPEHPVSPMESASIEAHTTQRMTGRLEAMLMGMPAEGSGMGQPSSEEQYELTSTLRNAYKQRISLERSQERQGYGRRRIPAANLDQSSMQAEVIQMDNEDPLLKIMAKQINESIDAPTTLRPRTTQSSWMPLPYGPHSYETTQPETPPSVPSYLEPTTAAPMTSSAELNTLAPTQATESSTTSFNWPSDFLSTNSTERIDRLDDGAEDDYRYYEDTLNSAQMHSDLSISETLLPKLPLNITRVGVPYEQQNASNESTICVPLTVNEPSFSSDSAEPIVIEVERVYCFPLPKVEIKSNNGLISQQPTEHKSNTNVTVGVRPTEQFNGSAGFYYNNNNNFGGALILVIIWYNTLAWTWL